MDHPFNQIYMTGTVAQVDIDNSRLSGKHACHTGICRYPGKLFKCGLGRTVIGNRHLTDSNYLVQHHDIFHQAVCQRLHRNPVGACIGIGADPFVFQRMRLCQKRRHIPSYAVRSDTARHGSNTVHNQILQLRFRSSGLKTAFTAAAQNMLMTVNKSRHSRHAFPVKLLHFQASSKVCLQLFTHCRYFSSKHQNIPDPGIFRLIYLCISDKCNHCHFISHLLCLFSAKTQSAN